MAQKKDDRTAAERAVALYILLLLSGREHTLSSLAEEFNCSKQAILKTIQAIESRGDEIDSGFRGRERYYRIKAPRSRPHFGLTPRDIQQLVLCRDMLLRFLPKSMLERLDKLLGASTTLMHDYSKRDDALSSVCRAEIKGRIDYEPFTAIFEDAEKAIRERRLCRVAYRSLGNNPARELVFAPLLFLNLRESFYLRGMKVGDAPPHAELASKLLAVHRIERFDMLTTTHRIETPPDTTKADSFGLWKDTPFRVRVSFKKSAATYVRERIWSTDQLIEYAEDESLILEFTATSQPEVIAWILSFGDSAECLAPPEVREEIIRRISRLADLYR